MVSLQRQLPQWGGRSGGKRQNTYKTDFGSQHNWRGAMQARGHNKYDSKHGNRWPISARNGFSINDGADKGRCMLCVAVRQVETTA